MEKVQPKKSASKLLGQLHSAIVEGVEVLEFAIARNREEREERRHEQLVEQLVGFQLLHSALVEGVEILEFAHARVNGADAAAALQVRDNAISLLRKIRVAIDATIDATTGPRHE